MITEKMIEKADLVKLKVPKRAQDVIPVKKVYDNGTFYAGDRYSLCFRLKDIDYSNLKEEEQRTVLGKWSDNLNALDTRASYKLSICSRRLNVNEQVRRTFVNTNINDGFDGLRTAYNQLRWQDIDGESGCYVKEKYITMSSSVNGYRKTSQFLKTAGENMNRRLKDIGSGAECLSCEDRLHLIHDFFRPGREDEFNFTYSDDNSRYFKNYVAPESITFDRKGDKFRINDLYGRSFMILTWGDHMDDAFLNSLTDVKTNIFCSMDVIPLSKGASAAFVESKEDNVEGSANQWSNRPYAKNSASRLPKNISNERKAVDEWNDDLKNRGQKVFFCQITGVFLAESEEKLDEYTEYIRNVCNEKNAVFGVLWFRQYEGLVNALPYGIRCVNNLRDCNTETTAIMLPFSSVSMNDLLGIPYGRHELTHQQQYVDRLAQPNGHEFALGTTGYGKSLNEKLKIFCIALLIDADIIVCDPDGEYSPLISAIGGQVINMGEDRINIMELPSGYDDKDPVKKKSNFLISLIESILGDTFMGEKEKSIIDRCTKLLYQWDMQGFYEAPPTWKDWYDILIQQTDAEAGEMILGLERHITGSFNCFAGYNDVYRDSRILSYNLSSLPKSMKDAGMMICLDDIDQRLMKNRTSGRFTFIFFDEMDYYFKHRNSIQQIEDFYERARKYNGIITGIIQYVDKLLVHEEAQTMLINADNIVMMHQETVAARQLQEMYDLSENQFNYLVGAEPGFGINKIGSMFYSFDGRIPESNMIYDLINTDGARKRS